MTRVCLELSKLGSQIADKLLLMHVQTIGFNAEIEANEAHRGAEIADGVHRSKVRGEGINDCGRGACTEYVVNNYR